MALHTCEYCSQSFFYNFGNFMNFLNHFLAEKVFSVLYIIILYPCIIYTLHIVQLLAKNLSTRKRMTLCEKVTLLDMVKEGNFIIIIHYWCVYGNVNCVCHHYSTPTYNLLGCSSYVYD